MDLAQIRSKGPARAVRVPEAGTMSARASITPPRDPHLHLAGGCHAFPALLVCPSTRARNRRPYNQCVTRSRRSPSPKVVLRVKEPGYWIGARRRTSRLPGTGRPGRLLRSGFGGAETSGSLRVMTKRHPS